MINKKIKIADLFAYRNVWMGIAIISIVIYHAEFTIQNNILHFVTRMGYGGVDIFLFASGIGCYYSLEKDDNPLSFLKRRFLKLMPTYWLFMVAWCAYSVVVNDIPFEAIIGNLFCVQSIIGFSDSFNWYMSMIWIVYILSPYLKKIIDTTKTKKSFALLIAFLLILSIPFWNERHLIIMVTRLPIFAIGMYVAQLGKKEMYISRLHSLVLMVLSIIGVCIYTLSYHLCYDCLWNYGLHWYPFILITPGLCLIISFLFQSTKLRPGKKLLDYIGEHSFEIYLIHILIFQLYDSFVAKGYIPASNIMKFLSILCIIPSVFFLKLFTKIIISNILKRR